MADKQWNEELRRSLSEYGETPPEGLWEALEASGSVGKTGVAADGIGKAGAAAGGGLLSRLLGSVAPAWWALAGVAAAVAAVLIVAVPSRQTVDPGTLAEATAGQTPASSSAPASGASSRVQKAPVLHTDPAQTPDPYAKEAVFAHGDTDTPVTPEEEESDLSDNDDIQTGKGDARSEKGDDMPDGQKADVDHPSEIEQIVTDGGEDLPDPWEAVTIPVSPQNTSRPLLAAALTGAGMPGGSVTDTYQTYGFSGRKTMLSTKTPSVSILSRNKRSDVVENHRIDYQFGLMLHFSLSEHWGLESGLQYTNLSSSMTETTGSLGRTIQERMGYVGISLLGVWTPWRGHHASLYLSAGPAVELGVLHASSSFDTIGGESTHPQIMMESPWDWVFSASVNAGVQWQPWSYGAFFIQPGVVGRLCTDKSPVSYYTEHPVSFRIAAGYRILF